MIANKNYVSSLDHFLESSWEDEVDVQGLMVQIPVFAKNLNNHITEQKTCSILDIGSGNGKKSFLIAEALYKTEVKPTIICIDPKKEQIGQVARTFAGKTEWLHAVHNTSFEAFSTTDEFDLVIFLHSLYEFPRNSDYEIVALKNIPSLLSAHGACAIILEDADSDFQKIKKEFATKLELSEQFSIHMLEKSLQRTGITYTIGNQIDLRFPIDIELSTKELGCSIEFLFSEFFNNHETIADDLLEQVGEWMKREVHCDQHGAHYLSVPNRVVWIV